MCPKCIICVSKVHDREVLSQGVELVSSANAKTRQWLAGDEDWVNQTWCMERSVARFTLAFRFIRRFSVTQRVVPLWLQAIRAVLGWLTMATHFSLTSRSIPWSSHLLKYKMRPIGEVKLHHCVYQRNLRHATWRPAAIGVIWNPNLLILCLQSRHFRYREWRLR